MGKAVPPGIYAPQWCPEIKPQVPGGSGLTPALRWWWDPQGYKQCNNALRSGGVESLPQHKKQLIEDLCLQCKLGTDVIAMSYRGVHHAHQHSNWFKAKVGDVVVYPGFLSGTTDIKIAKHFARWGGGSDHQYSTQSGSADEKEGLVFLHMDGSSAKCVYFKTFESQSLYAPDTHMKVTKIVEHNPNRREIYVKLTLASYMKAPKKLKGETAAIPHDMRNIIDDADKPDSTEGEANFVDDGNGKVKSSKSHEFLGMVCDEARASAMWESLSSEERAAYALAIAAIKPPVAPAVKKPLTKPSMQPLAKGKPTANIHPKKAFNNAVHKHFAGGRTLSAQHRSAISEGLKRYHAAAGHGSYNMGQRNKAIKHVNKHLAAKADHHLAMHQHYKTRANEHKKAGRIDIAARMNQRAKGHLLKHKLHSKLVKPLFTKETNPGRNPAKAIAASSDWWSRLSKSKQQDYLRNHPHSEFIKEATPVIKQPFDSDYHNGFRRNDFHGSNSSVGKSLWHDNHRQVIGDGPNGNKEAFNHHKEIEGQLHGLAKKHGFKQADRENVYSHPNGSRLIIHKPSETTYTDKHAGYTLITPHNKLQATKPL